ncbi:DRC1 protein, partial [Lophotis ruficrista]|nr:DRC1 protein [Lophotis ruficrista]
QKLAKLLFHGTQMVTDIQVAADQREMQRRAEEAELKRERLEKLEKEAKSSTARFEEITSKWALAKGLRIPQELWQLLSQQQQRCTVLLEEKNKLIADLQQELKNKDERYAQAVRKQSDDVHLLLERMEEQTRLMLKTYRRRLLQMEKAFELERRELLDNNRKEWEEAMQAHRAREVEHLHARKKKVEEYEKQLRKLGMQDEEEYNNMKTRLENDVQNLERQIQQVKAAYHLNREKLEYNRQVLEKRDEENTTLRSRQKRKINRYNSGLLNNLRKKLAEQEKQFREETQSLAADRERIARQHEELQRRMRHFAVSDAKKFREVWQMNEEEAKGLARKALDADRVIHSQQLGLPWEEPPSPFLNSLSPLQLAKARVGATKLAAEVLREVGGGGEENPAKAEDRLAALRNISKATAKRILELVSDESGFLVERELLRPLGTLGRRKRILLKLDSIFAALQIHSEDDLHQLVEFFLNYKAQEVAGELEAPRGRVALVWRRRRWWKAKRPAHPASLQGQDSPGEEDVPDPAEDGEDGGAGARRDELKSPGSSLGSLPPLHIHADDVLKILKAFVRDCDKLREKDGSAEEEAWDISGAEEYWEALAHVLPEARLKLWDALAAALKEY